MAELSKYWQEQQAAGDVPSSGNDWFAQGPPEGSTNVYDGGPTTYWQDRQDAGDVPSSHNNWFDQGPPTVPDTTTPVVQEQTFTPAPFVQDTATIPSVGGLMGQVENPTIPDAGFQRTVQQQVQANELLDPTVGQIAKPTKQPAATAQTTTGSVDPIAQQAAIKAQEIEADQAVAQTGTVTLESTMQGQMANLMDDIASGKAPWADGAMRKAQAIMMNRGLGKSSMAGAAIGAAILEAAMPIAQYDASVFGEMNMQNLRNRQETMLSNTASSNVAKQINAQSVNDVNKFMSTLRDGVLKFNESQKSVMDQFNAEQTNTSEKFNATQKNTMTQFYAQQEDQANKFNSENALAIMKSNGEWRRTTNTANTAAVNSTNMINAQNYFNISQQAQANLWQRSRDVFNWANQIGKNERDRAQQLTMYVMQQDAYMQQLDDEAESNLWGAVGGWVADVFSEIDWSGGAE